MPRPHWSAVVSVVASVALLGGCSGGSPAAGDDPSGAPSGGSPSISPSPVPSVEPAPPAPAAARSRKPAGQRAFARHVMDLWAYALRTNDPKPLAATRLGKVPCGGCAPLAEELASRRTQGWTVDFPGLEVRSIRLSSQGGDRVARARVDVPASDSYNDDGTFRNTSPAHKGAEFLVQMRYVESQWRLVSFSAG
jgi:Family of unknown function (DUF6318)